MQTGVFWSGQAKHLLWLSRNWCNYVQGFISKGKMTVVDSSQAHFSSLSPNISSFREPLVKEHRVPFVLLSATSAFQMILISFFLPFADTVTRFWSLLQTVWMKWCRGDSPKHSFTQEEKKTWEFSVITAPALRHRQFCCDRASGFFSKQCHFQFFARLLL